jgi:hypothetical protein
MFIVIHARDPRHESSPGALGRATTRAGLAENVVLFASLLIRAGAAIASEAERGATGSLTGRLLPAYDPAAGAGFLIKITSASTEKVEIEVITEVGTAGRSPWENVRCTLVRNEPGSWGIEVLPDRNRAEADSDDGPPPTYRQR